MHHGKIREPVQGRSNVTVVGGFRCVQKHQNISCVFGDLGAIGVCDRASEWALIIGARKLAGNVYLPADPHVNLVARAEPDCHVASDLRAIVRAQRKEGLDGANVIDIHDAVNVIEALSLDDPAHEGFGRRTVPGWVYAHGLEQPADTARDRVLADAGLGETLARGSRHLVIGSPQSIGARSDFASRELEVAELQPDRRVYGDVHWLRPL